MKNQTKLDLPLKTLLFLNHMEEEGEGRMHYLEVLFPNLPTSAKRAIFEDLAEANFIILTGRGSDDLLEGESVGLISQLLRESAPFMGKITFRGLIFLKEELEMRESGKYKINLAEWEADNLIVLQSNNHSITSRPDFSEKIDQIIQILETDEAITEKLREKAIAHFHKGKEKVNKSGKLPKKFSNRTMHLDDEIPSIRNLLYQLW